MPSPVQIELNVPNSRVAGALAKPALGFLLVALFSLYSRVFDFVLTYLHVTAIAYGATIFAAFMLGGARRAFSHRIGLLLVGLLAWLAVCIPFSIYKMGSLSTVLVTLEFGLCGYFVIAGLLVDYGDLRRTVHTLAYAVLLLALLTIPFGKELNGRIYPGEGRFANPNDFAQLLLMMLPFWWYMFRTPLNSLLRRGLAICAIGFILVMMANTGSRGALVGLAVTILVPFLWATARQKVAMAVSGVLLLGLSALLLPEHIERRFFTLFDASSPDSLADDSASQAAIGSTESRKQLLEDSLSLTLTHPVFGVGPGAFGVAQDELAKSRGKEKGSWLGTHNSFTQISSEAGIPALILYLAVLIFSIRAVSVRRIPAGTGDPVVEDMAELSVALRAALVAYAVSTLFSAVAYTMFLPTLAAFAVVFDRAVNQRLRGRVCPPVRTAPPARVTLEHRLSRRPPLPLVR